MDESNNSTQRPANVLLESIAETGAGGSIYELAGRIFPICRSITGNGVRETLSILSEHIPLKIQEVASGTEVFDWTVPREWNISDAYIKDETGRRVVDFRDNNLCVVNYSIPVRSVMPLSELKRHIITLPDAPDLIPYRTSYYRDSWGFCMAHSQFEKLADGNYEVVIDSTLEDGALTYGEYLHRGTTEQEVLLSAHICHPSLANDNCSGVALLTELARRLMPVRTGYSYRFLFAPGTIGAITWLARNEKQAERIKHGLVVSCVGDRGGPNYKRSRRGDALIDRAVSHVLSASGHSGSIQDFSPYGYDERQYCSPGFNLPVGMLQRSRFGQFPEYHTSGDNMQFIASEALADSIRIIVDAIYILENDDCLINTNPKCEPQLGRRKLYASNVDDKAAAAQNLAMLWVLNLSDGENSLLDIAERSGVDFKTVSEIAKSLQAHGLLVGA